MKNNNLLNQLSKTEWDLFIIKILNRYRWFWRMNHEMGFEDLQQEAWLSLLQACSNFKPEKKTKFTTFAYIYINLRLLRTIREKTKNKFHLIDYNSLSEDEKQDVLHSVECYRDSDDSLETREIKDIVMKNLKDEDDFEILYDKYFNDKSFKDIATKRGLTRQTIHYKVRKMVAKINGILDDNS